MTVVLMIAFFTVDAIAFALVIAVGIGMFGFSAASNKVGVRFDDTMQGDE